MCELMISPWNDFTELETVYNCIYNNNENEVINYDLIEFAKNKLTIWLTRIENNNEIKINLMATKAILNALIEDNNRAENRDESSIYALFALSVIQFCTALSQYSKESNMKSVRRLAIRYSCPQWIIDCRHSLCHSSQNQPSIEDLRSASQIGLNWLKKYFWDKIIAINNYNNCDNYESIDRYINCTDSKIRKKIKNEMIYSVKHFRNEFISSLIIHLIDIYSNDEKEINFDTIKLPKVYLRKFAPIFTIIVNHNSIQLFLYLLMDYFNDNSKVRRYSAICWFSTVINSIKVDQKVSKFERSFESVSYSSVMHKIDWIRLLYKLTKYPNPHTSTLMEMIAPIVSDYVSEEMINQMITLSNIYYESNKSSGDEHMEIDGNKGYAMKTVKDLIHSSNDNEVNDQTDWSKINLGSNYLLSATEQDCHIVD